MVDIFSSPPFYTDDVKLPTVDDPVPTVDNPVPPEIQQNPKFWPYFKDALGVIDGVISIFQPMYHFMIFTETAKATCPKIASLSAHLVFSFSVLSLNGKALPLMLVYGMMPLGMILWFQRESII